MRAARQRGFTLIELLVVMVILGITLGLVSLNALPGQKQSLREDAQRIALLLQLARDEAIVRNRQIAFEAGPDGYRFLIRNEREWTLAVQDDLLREREFKHGPITLMLDPPPSIPDAGNLRIVFGREPVDKPFVLTLSGGDASIAIRADGIGHFTVD
ncbi:prepilin-type N-terminal cleavage/methylation domain-containing protein [Rugamonas sp. FT107W]|uniref:Type II secretion system protein H n=1 Tax=Duganella vulcania TaxID=2692166 RepID=A0A845HKF5_9BURK|nr:MULTISPECIES: GspH/FimT family pseudopilin [Duganella]MYN19261.1 prepilin-type N-terminal cleavage/methylation domain-containing protein [Duganella vulcania]NVD70451.1 GspH/FimT family pseudopilin [Duganella sp. BJB1802]